MAPTNYPSVRALRRMHDLQRPMPNCPSPDDHEKWKLRIVTRRELPAEK